MLTAFRPIATCASIHGRCGAHADVAIADATAPSVGTAAIPGKIPGGRGGVICATAASEPVATPGSFATRRPAYRPIAFRVTPVRRAISRWLVPLARSVSIVIRKYGFKTFTPSPQ